MDSAAAEKGLSSPEDPLDGTKVIDISEQPAGASSTSSPATEAGAPDEDEKTGWRSYVARVAESNWIELRGIQRVQPEEQAEFAGAHSYVQMLFLWSSANMTANNLALGFLGPIAYGLSFTDSALCAVFGALAGSMGTAFMGTWGPISGLRTMIAARYTMGWWPSRICVLLNIVIMLGYGMIDCVIGGQIISAVAGGNLTVVAGIIVVAVLSLVLTVFGLPLFHIYERYAWVPQLLVLFILVGVAGSNFDTSYASDGDAETVNANRLSFFSLCLSSAVAWAPVGADYYVYFAKDTSKLGIFLLTWLGEGISLIIVYLLGCGIGAGTYSNDTWYANYEVSSGALIVGAFDPLSHFGKFCSVILALGVIANNIPGTYSAALGFQCLGEYPAKIPRLVWNVISVVIYTICAAVGRDYLFEIFENFLALMGYWVVIWICLTLEELFIFRKGWAGFCWDDWNDREKLPIGLAAFASFCIGWVGSVLGMDQIYFIGPLAKPLGAYGGDLGIYLGVAFAGITYPVFRFAERKFFGR
ncbi:nucleoside transporter family [Xylariales sp. PMI_506]|nr:nucleoside transporter family [Xylariales sp. PMI_506]